MIGVSRERKGPPTFWHPGNVDGPFRRYSSSTLATCQPNRRTGGRGNWSRGDVKQTVQARVRLDLGGTTGAFLIVAAGCPVCGEVVCLDRSTYQKNYECPLCCSRRAKKYRSDLPKLDFCRFLGFSEGEPPW